MAITDRPEKHSKSCTSISDNTERESLPIHTQRVKEYIVFNGQTIKRGGGKGEQHWARFGVWGVVFLHMYVNEIR